MPIVEKISRISTEKIATTIVNHTELLYGAFNSQKKKQNLERIEDFLGKIQILPFCESASYIFAEQDDTLY